MVSASLHSDLIAAVATPPGQGGIGIVRLSGHGAKSLAEKVAQAKLEPRKAVFTKFFHAGQVLDEGLVILFPRPNSFTGEEVVEFQGHGSPVVLQLLLNTLCEQGARLARPGEFSERAYLNGKMDLAQAEAIADLIASASATAARGAMRSLQGEFSARVNALAAGLEKLRIFVEAAIDFPDEDVDILADHQVLTNIQQLRQQLADLLAQTQQGQLLAEGASVTLLGAPNTGKSSLLNVLAGEEAAIVTDIPGTTRDLLKVDLIIGGIPIRLVDTAGLRETSERVEQLGIERAQKQAQLAEVILVVVDASQGQDIDEEVSRLCGLSELRVGDKRIFVVMNKQDLVSRIDTNTTYAICHVSAKTGDGMEILRQHIQQRVGFVAQEAPFTARARHVDALQVASAALQQAQDCLQNKHETEIVAEELRLAHNALGEIVGTVSADDLLGKIFSEFCIGK
ncbi:MAG: tRNA uridine-5-carboxymethylaminomethyl(34) synthesis GTPase MnmE [Gammaproteobacteria bacterium]|nr:tRNA uridine-5-carboxymethylaminomethyl(34) synthesis GTPase MnmE [Gammaproteobacteria bacterium]